MIFQTWRTYNTFYFNTVGGDYYSLDKHEIMSFPKWKWITPVEESKNNILSPAILGVWND